MMHDANAMMSYDRGESIRKSQLFAKARLSRKFHTDGAREIPSAPRAEHAPHLFRWTPWELGAHDSLVSQPGLEPKRLRPSSPVLHCSLSPGERAKRCPALELRKGRRYL